MAKITHPDDLDEDIANFKKLQSGEIKGYSKEKRYLKPDGSVVWVHIVVSALCLLNEQSNRHICLVQDITERRAIENALVENERSKSVLLSHLPGLAYRCFYDREWTMQYVSDGCFDLTGYPPERLLYNKALSFNDLITPEYREPLWAEWARCLAKRLPFKHEYPITTAEGSQKWVLEMGQGIYDNQGEVEALEGIILDISERKEIENNLRYNNEHDRWTGTYNRTYFENLFRRDIEKSSAEKRAVVGINLSAAHSLVATYGFHYTQDLIKKVTDALTSLCNDKCILFSTYVSLFVFYVNSYKGKNELTALCRAIANTLSRLLEVERIGTGIGIVEIEENNDDVEQLLKNLLIASEKSLSMCDRDIDFCFYDADMEAQTIREAEIKYELTQIVSAADDGGLLLHYQPILDLKSNRICGFEALSRLQSDKLGLVPPLEFIPIAEKSKLIIPLGRKIIRHALHFLNRLKENGYAAINVSINVSAIELLSSDFTNNLFEIIHEMQANPQNINLEITESVFSANYQEVNSIIGQLRDAGLYIALDDFGTGYSSLARERALNINCLKIDKYFIDKLMIINPDMAITGDIISMAHKLGHCVVAEGVEYEEQRAYLLHCGCDKIQGYLISKPLEAEAAIELLKTSGHQAPGSKMKK